MVMQSLGNSFSFSGSQWLRLGPLLARWQLEDSEECPGERLCPEALETVVVGGRWSWLEEQVSEGYQLLRGSERGTGGHPESQASVRTCRNQH